MLFLFTLIPVGDTSREGKGHREFQQVHLKLPVICMCPFLHASPQGRSWGRVPHTMSPIFHAVAEERWVTQRFIKRIPLTQ